MRPRHRTLRNETVLTPHGLVQLDGQGHVSNMEELNLSSPEQLLTVPDFLDADLFPSPHPVDVQSKVSVQATLEVKKTEGVPDEVYASVIEDLLKVDGQKVTGEGHIDMGVLSTELRKRGLPLISGVKRKEIWDAHLTRQQSTKSIGN